MEARMESLATSATSKLQVKVCMICTTVLQTRIMVNALTMNAQPREHISVAARFREGSLYSGSSMMKKDFRCL